MKKRPVAIVVALAVLIGIGVGLLIRHLNRPDNAYGITALDHTTKILAFGPRPPASPALDQVRSHLDEELRALGWSTRSQEFERTTPAGRLRFANLRARYGNDDPWQRPVTLLLGCHIDSKIIDGMDFLGADDSASAAGAILVIAAELNSDPDQARQLELVFFDGEEAFGRNISTIDGLYGSRQYARELRKWNPRPRHGIILDMIGHRKLAIRIPSDTPDTLREHLFEAARERGAGNHFGVAPGPILDDHVPLNQAGVPTIDIIGDFSRSGWWHTGRDNIHLLSEESLDISIRVTLRLIERLLR